MQANYLSEQAVLLVLHSSSILLAFLLGNMVLTNVSARMFVLA